jgi:hypothetical protein
VATPIWKGSDVLMAVPTRGTIVAATVAKLEYIHRQYNVGRLIFWQPGNMSVARTRNYIVKHFLEETKCKYLFMVDDDIVPPTAAIETCLMLNKRKFGIICTPHVLPSPDKKQLAFGIYSHNPDKSIGGYTLISPQPGLHECDGVATGCVAVSRKMLMELGPDPFQMPDNVDSELGTDDFYFCRDVQKAGWKVGYYWNERAEYCDHFARISIGTLMQRSVAIAQVQGSAA